MIDNACKLNRIGYENFELTMNMLRGKWKLRILYMLASHQVLRYGELKRLLASISHKMLNAQLKELEDDGFILRTEYPQVPPKLEYTLTEKGMDLREVFEALADWILKYNKEI